VHLRGAEIMDLVRDDTANKMSLRKAKPIFVMMPLKLILCLALVNLIQLFLLPCKLRADGISPLGFFAWKQFFTIYKPYCYHVNNKLIFVVILCHFTASKELAGRGIERACNGMHICHAQYWFTCRQKIFTTDSQESHSRQTSCWFPFQFNKLYSHYTNLSEKITLKI
jgi:hypothetical protein